MEFFRSEPSEGLFTTAMTSCAGVVNPMVVEPPPSSPTASTHPSSSSRWATWAQLAPMLWPGCFPSTV